METTKTENPATEAHRAFDFTIDIDAAPDAVWRALTDAEELVRWFPLRAAVTPGPGGSITWKWEDSWDWTTRIDRWEPARLLRLVQDYSPSNSVAPATVAIEFKLESHRGQTRLRMVHSGFGEGAAWDNELDSISEGWPSELRSLKLYLERHRGRDRTVGRVQVSVPLPRETVWARLTGPDGLNLTPVEPQAGSDFTITVPGGPILRGNVAVALPQRSLTGIIPELETALLRLVSWSQPDGKSGAWIWLATYTNDPQPAGKFERSARQMVERLFPEAAPV